MVDQYSALRVKLSDLIEGMDFQLDESFSYLNTATGEVVAVTTEELRATEEDAPLDNFPEWQHDAMAVVCQQRRRVLLEAIGEEERHTAGRQHLDGLVDHALRHGQRTIADIPYQQIE